MARKLLKPSHSSRSMLEQANQLGFVQQLLDKVKVLSDFILLVVPAIIALAMVGSSIFLMLSHPERDVPAFMVNSLTTILGYYFGVGVAKT